LKQYNGGVSVPTLDRKTVHRIEVLVPPKNLLTAFDKFATPLFEQMENLKQQNQKLRDARDLLLPRLMSGEIAVCLTPNFWLYSMTGAGCHTKPKGSSSRRPSETMTS